MRESKFWVHYCLKDHGLEYVERDRECNWCGAREQDIPIERDEAAQHRQTAPVRAFIAEPA